MFSSRIRWPRLAAHNRMERGSLSASRVTGGGRFGSGQLAAASTSAAVVRMAAAFRRGARAQHAMVLTRLLHLKAAVLTASCTRLRREADSPDHARMVTVEKVWTRGPKDGGILGRRAMEVKDASAVASAWARS